MSQELKSVSLLSQLPFTEHIITARNEVKERKEDMQTIVAPDSRDSTFNWENKIRLYLLGYAKGLGKYRDDV